MKHPMTCRRCGVAMMGTLSKKYCSECAVVNKREQSKLYRPNKRGILGLQSGELLVGRPPSYEVVRDPDTESGFPAGALLDRDSVMVTLQYGYFTPGMVLRNMGALLVVEQDGKKQRLAKCEEMR